MVLHKPLINMDFLQLNGESEQVANLYVHFTGFFPEIMQRLVTGEIYSQKHFKRIQVDEQRTPASILDIIERRESAPEDVRATWQNYEFYTSDAICYSPKCEALFILDAPQLRQVTTENTQDLSQSPMALTLDDWNALKAQTEKVLYLTAEEMSAVKISSELFSSDRSGFDLKKEYCDTEQKYKTSWVPINAHYGKVIEFLTRGYNYQNYLENVSKGGLKLSLHNSPVFSNFKPNLLIPLSITNISQGCTIYGTTNSCFPFSDGTYDMGSKVNLIGISPKVAITKEDARIRKALEAGESFTFNGILYAPVEEK